VEFVKAIGILTVSGCISTDYWVDKNSADIPWFPLFPSFYRAIRYHCGSAIFGALVLAIIRLIRYIMMYIDSKTAELQKNNRWAKVVMAVVHCCLWCLEKCARFLTYSAYIMTSIEGNSFCVSAWRSFKLIFSNSLRVAATQTLATIIIILAQLGITASCTLLCYVSITSLEIYGPEGEDYVDSAVVPCILVFLSSFFVTSCFMGVYDTAIQTLLLSFCLDEDKFKRGLYKDKRDNTGQPDARMFCVVNEKVGLIKLVAGSVKKHVKAAAKEKEELAKLDALDEPREKELAP
jgi:choline transporter-like protein 2/4/5